MGMDNLTAAKTLKEAIELPPAYVDGHIIYPEGPVKATTDDYVALHGQCKHELLLTVVSLNAINTYLATPKGWRGAHKRAVLAPVMRSLVMAHDQIEKLGGVQWAK